MSDEVKLSRVESRFAELNYPVTRTDAAERFSETTLLFADGQANLGELVDEMESERFDGVDELTAELNNTLPIEAVGEPGQSEGDA